MPRKKSVSNSNGKPSASGESGSALKLIIGFIVLVLFIIAAFRAVKLPVFNGNNFLSSPRPTAVAQVVTDYPVSVNLPGMPTDIHKPRSATIIAQKKITAGDKVQLTQMMISPKSIEENYDYYIDQFEKNDWKIVSQSTAGNGARTIFAQGSTGIMNVIIEPDPDVKGRTDITLNFVFK